VTFIAEPRGERNSGNDLPRVGALWRPVSF